jgi:hypothetical protein
MQHGDPKKLAPIQPITRKDWNAAGAGNRGRTKRIHFEAPYENGGEALA